MSNPDIYNKLKTLSSTLDNQVTNFDGVQGAVVFLFVRDGLFLIKRSTRMKSHKAQVAFIGGHVDPIDKTIKDTAFREFEEETGVSHERLEYLGILPGVNTMRSKKIVPVLCYIDTDPNEFIKEVVSNGEWSEAMIVDYNHLMQLDYWSHGKSMTLDKNYNIMFRPMSNRYFISSIEESEKDRVLWGATARMIWDFHHKLWSKL